MHLTGQNKTKGKTNGVLEYFQVAITHVQCTVHEYSIQPPITDRLVAGTGKGYVVRGEMAYKSVALQLTHGAY